MNAEARQLSSIQSNIIMRHCRSHHFTMPSYHWHDGYEIYLFLEGNICCYIEQACIHPSRGYLCVIRPNELHRIECVDTAPYERLTIQIQSPYMDELCSGDTDLRACFLNRPFGLNTHRQLNEQEVVTLTLLAHKLTENLHSEAYGHDVLARAALQEILVLANRRFLDECHEQNSNDMPAAVVETMRFIEDNLSSDLTLQAIGQSVHYDAGYISRRFREITGIAVSKYIMYKRVLLAKQLLLEGVEPKEAASRVGFGDYSVFYRSFVRLAGHSPSAFLADAKTYDKSVTSP